MIDRLKKELRKFASEEKSLVYARFFKTGEGQYGYGDIFLGLSVPQSRSVAKKFTELGFDDIKKLLRSKIHEERLVALLILVDKFNKNYDKKKIYDFYMKNSQKVNNWDLVDLSADKIVGKYLMAKDKSILYKLAKSSNLWQRRISIIATFHFIKNNSFDYTIRISEILLNDNHDLIQKAVGWMLREMGKRDEKELLKFLDKNYKNMPRTMLRYSIEKLDKKKKELYMKK